MSSSEKVFPSFTSNPDVYKRQVYLSGKDQDVITVTFGNDKMGSLLIVKKDAVTGAPISDVEFLVTDSDGSCLLYTSRCV